ncbi:MAG TPA: HD domain-containing protein [Terriglobales bacterium]|nr:HD domain-containing protein [Terriglobales bacterium]
MKDFYIRDAAQQENKTITSCFVVCSKQIKPKKSGDLFIALTLADRTGQLEAKVWDNVQLYLDCFEQDDFIKVKGLLNKYNNHFQLTIHKLRRLDENEIDYADYLPKTDKDVEQLWATLVDYVGGFRNQNLKALLQAFINDPEIAQAYKTAPAAKTLHHAYIGGLLVHVVSLFQLCELAARNYPQIDRDLLLTGAFLHDIGKLHELSYARSFSYTTRGQLLGHMIIELEMLQSKLEQLPGFPPELKTLIEHMIISHHGQYEFGSPKLPMFPEALMLHYLDDLDSKMESMRAQFERQALNEDAWAGYNSALGRPLLDPAKFLNPKPADNGKHSEVAQTEAPQACPQAKDKDNDNGTGKGARQTAEPGTQEACAAAPENATK